MMNKKRELTESVYLDKAAKAHNFIPGLLNPDSFQIPTR